MTQFLQENIQLKIELSKFAKRHRRVTFWGIKKTVWFLHCSRYCIIPNKGTPPKHPLTLRVGFSYISCLLCVAVNHGYDTYFGNGLVMGYADCKCFAGLIETSKVVSIVNLGLCQTHCKQSARLFPPFLPSGQYGLWFGYYFSGPLPLRYHKEEVTFSGPFLGVPCLLDYTRNRPEPSKHWSSVWPPRYSYTWFSKCNIACF